ncbi:MAG: DNA-protecting protein DprA [Bacteroidetes bacterium]|nr:DNA-protecting protein DprA [Bacteroidota bacterium]
MNKSDIYALKQIKGVGDKSILNVISSKLQIQDIISMDEESLGQFIKGSRKVDAINEIQNNYSYYQDVAEQKLLDFESNEINVISYMDEKYPLLYKKIKKPPVFLYVKGNISLLKYQNSIAIVGTRDCSNHGEKIARNTAKYFAERDFNIVSGLALGIDTAAHKGAISVKGKTTAVVVDIKKIFPSENKQLSENILNCDGVLISENEPGAFVNRGLFVSRDRLQSGLSLAVFPVETDVKGGTMHTVGFAQEQNRLLFCPDISKINYEQGFSKIRGIEKLINENIAKPYTKNTYKEILVFLEEKRVKLLTTNKQGNLTLGL